MRSVPSFSRSLDAVSQTTKLLLCVASAKPSSIVSVSRTQICSLPCFLQSLALPVVRSPPSVRTVVVTRTWRLRLCSHSRSRSPPSQLRLTSLWRAVPSRTRRLSTRMPSCSARPSRQSCRSPPVTSQSPSLATVSLWRTSSAVASTTTPSCQLSSGASETTHACYRTQQCQWQCSLNEPVSFLRTRA